MYLKCQIYLRQLVNWKKFINNYENNWCICFLQIHHLISWPIVINDPGPKWEWVTEVSLRTKNQQSKRDSAGSVTKCQRLVLKMVSSPFIPLILHQLYTNLLLVLRSLTPCHSFWHQCGFMAVVIRGLIGWSSPPFRLCLRSLASNSLSKANSWTHTAAHQTILSSWKPISQLGCCNNMNHFIT